MKRGSARSGSKIRSTFRYIIHCESAALALDNLMRAHDRAASIRRKSYRSSLFAASNLLHERFEARIAAKIVEEWISREEEQVAFIASRKAVLERFDGTFFFA